MPAQLEPSFWPGPKPPPSRRLVRRRTGRELPMTTLRLHVFIALGLCAAGVPVYFWSSDAPARVHAVTVPLQLLFLVGGVALATHQRLGPRVRFLVGLAFVAVFAGAWSYSISLVVVKIEPSYPGFVLTLAAALGVELAVFVGLVWLLGTAYRRLFEGHRCDPTPH